MLAQTRGRARGVTADAPDRAGRGRGGWGVAECARERSGERTPTSWARGRLRPRSSSLRFKFPTVRLDAGVFAHGVECISQSPQTAPRPNGSAFVRRPSALTGLSLFLTVYLCGIYVHDHVTKDAAQACERKSGRPDRRVT